ncbi:MAG TPA: hypothetical protein VG102_04270, partial [Candidatus Paceibacterota bacterium]|nr:hypothetical protein [Candidatus Paceibacterota bacterium]
IRAILEVTPEAIDLLHACRLRIDLKRTFVRPDFYTGSDGLKVYVHGPVRDRESNDPDYAYYVSARIVAGKRTGHVLWIPIFGPDGFFEAYR